MQRNTDEIESRRQGQQNTGKERLKRIGSEKTKMKKCMFHLENRQQQSKERSRKKKTTEVRSALYICAGEISSKDPSVGSQGFLQVVKLNKVRK